MHGSFPNCVLFHDDYSPKYLQVVFVDLSGLCIKFPLGIIKVTLIVVQWEMFIDTKVLSRRIQILRQRRADW